ncbi:MAG TPA: hypothetical protein VMW12_07485 [Candidatus Dormibacteraeota bacterium]|nr:hypothetical protein [Candidatus Dormibacteraeota bacterium]
MTEPDEYYLPYEVVLGKRAARSPVALQYVREHKDAIFNQMINRLRVPQIDDSYFCLFLPSIVEFDTEDSLVLLEDELDMLAIKSFSRPIHNALADTIKRTCEYYNIAIRERLAVIIQDFWDAEEPFLLSDHALGRYLSFTGTQHHTRLRWGVACLILDAIAHFVDTNAFDIQPVDEARFFFYLLELPYYMRCWRLWHERNDSQCSCDYQPCGKHATLVSWPRSAALANSLISATNFWAPSNRLPRLEPPPMVQERQAREAAGLIP